MNTCDILQREKETSMRYVWLNLYTGEFSNSWDEETPRENFPTEESLKDAQDRCAEWKLIKYECVNQPSFEFDKNMKLK